MPPETYSGPRLISASLPRAIPERKKGSDDSQAPPTSKKRQRNSPKSSNLRRSPKTQIKPTITSSRKDDSVARYDRDFLLSRQFSSLSTRPPVLPPIPGVTVPRTKEIPPSLKVKLEKKGVRIKDDVMSAIPLFSPLTATSRNQTSMTHKHVISRHKDDEAAWKSCMYHVM